MGDARAPHVNEMQASVLRDGHCQRGMVKPVPSRTKPPFPRAVLKVNRFDS